MDQFVQRSKIYYLYNGLKENRIFEEIYFCYFYKSSGLTLAIQIVRMNALKILSASIRWRQSNYSAPFLIVSKLFLLSLLSRETNYNITGKKM